MCCHDARQDTTTTVPAERCLSSRLNADAEGSETFFDGLLNSGGIEPFRSGRYLAAVVKRVNTADLSPLIPTESRARTPTRCSLPWTLETVRIFCRNQISRSGHETVSSFSFAEISQMMVH